MNKQILSMIALIALSLGAAGIFGHLTPAAQAADRVATEAKATFKVENMTCALCPATVRRAMQRVDGVFDVSVVRARQQAVAHFDPALTDADAIAAAATAAGFPATPEPEDTAQ